MDIQCQEFVKERTTLLAIALLSLALAGCWNGRVLIAVEQPFWASRDGDRLLRWPLERAALTRGYVPRVLLMGPQTDPKVRLLQELAVRRYRSAVVGPLLSLESGIFASSSPQTRFLLLDDPSPLQPPANAVRLVFDREAAFRDAGRAAAISLRAEAGGTAVSGLSSRIVVLLSAHPTATQRELDAFTSGVARALDGGGPLVRRIADPVDRVSLKNAIDQMRREGAEFFLLLLGVPDSWCLEIMRGAGGSAIVTDWYASGALPGQVFLSIETDIPGAVARFLSEAKPSGSPVVGAARLVAGQARPVPSEVPVEARRP
ncbi:MAG TPA: hypothetical protein VMV03_17260 [Spirochaetia bacterium]|nr:hypothetical protein [Spirochaetia bacterium]